MSTGTRKISLKKVLMLFKGEYDSETTYHYADIVELAGSSYAVKVDMVKGIAPPNDNCYQLVAREGNGIANIEKTSTDGLVDTYTITYDNGTTKTYTVTNGKDGKDGEVSQEQLDAVIEVNNQQEKEITSLRTVLNALPKATGEGTEVTLNDTANTVFYEITPKGYTEQKSTNGSNMLDTSDIQTRTFNCVTITNNNDGSVTLNGTCTSSYGFNVELSNPISLKANTNYSLLLFTNGNFQTPGGTAMSLKDSSNNSVISVRITKSEENILNSSDNIASYFRIYLEANAVFNNCRIYPMLVKGIKTVEATSYEPYTGGEASPSPDYPQDIEVVTGNHTVFIHGKNHFDYTQAITGYIALSSTDESLATDENTRTSGWFLCKPNMTYVMSGGNRGRCQFKNSAGLITYANATTSGDNFIFTTLQDTVLCRMYVTNDLTNYPIENIQIEEGSVSTSYEPYQGSTYPISLGNIELCKIGNYEDYIFKNEVNSPYYDSNLTLDKWYKHSAVHKAILDGSENFSTNNKASTYYSFVLLTYENVVETSVSNNIFCNQLKAMTSNHAVNGCRISIQGSIVMDFPLDFCEYTIASLKSKISSLYNNGNPIILYFPYATPVDEKITDETLIEQLEALNYAMSMKGQTNISTSCSDENALMRISASAVKDISNILTNLETRIAELETAE